MKKDIATTVGVEVEVNRAAWRRAGPLLDTQGRASILGHIMLARGFLPEVLVGRRSPHEVIIECGMAPDGLLTETSSTGEITNTTLTCRTTFVDEHCDWMTKAEREASLILRCAEGGITLTFTGNHSQKPTE